MMSTTRYEVRVAGSPHHSTICGSYHEAEEVARVISVKLPGKPVEITEHILKAVVTTPASPEPIIKRYTKEQA